MSDRNLTYIYPILDRSASMAQTLDKTRLGFAEFIDTQRQVPGRALVTLAQFDTEYEIVYSLRDVDEVAALVLEPRGGTALLDGIGRTISAIEAQLSALGEDDRPLTVLVPILSDGKENSSTEYTWAMVHDLIEQCTRDGWLFSFIGASSDAIRVAAKLGVRREQALTYHPERIDDAFGVLARSASAYRTAARGGQPLTVAAKLASFTDKDRELVSAGSGGRHQSGEDRS